VGEVPAAGSRGDRRVDDQQRDQRRERLASERDRAVEALEVDEAQQPVAAEADDRGERALDELRAHAPEGVVPRLRIPTHSWLPQSGSRRTSMSSRPSDWTRSMIPCSSAWSRIEPWSTVSTRSTSLVSMSNRASTGSLRRPRILNSYFVAAIG